MGKQAGHFIKPEEGAPVKQTRAKEGERGSGRGPLKLLAQIHFVGIGAPFAVILEESALRRLAHVIDPRLDPKS